MRTPRLPLSCLASIAGISGAKPISPARISMPMVLEDGTMRNTRWSR